MSTAPGCILTPDELSEIMDLLRRASPDEGANAASRLYGKLEAYGIVDGRSAAGKGATLNLQPALYNHAASLGFSVISLTPDGSDLTPAQIRAAVMARVESLELSQEWLEACLPVEDTYQI